MKKDNKKDSLFTVDLPGCSTNEKLAKVKQLYPKLDPYFVASGCIKERREKFEKLWEQFKPYADNHFLNQIKILLQQMLLILLQRLKLIFLS